MWFNLEGNEMINCTYFHGYGNIKAKILDGIIDPINGKRDSLWWEGIKVNRINIHGVSELVFK